MKLLKRHSLLLRPMSLCYFTRGFFCLDGAFCISNRLVIYLTFPFTYWCTLRHAAHFENYIWSGLIVQYVHGDFLFSDIRQVLVFIKTSVSFPIVYFQLEYSLPIKSYWIGIRKICVRWISYLVRCRLFPLWLMMHKLYPVEDILLRFSFIPLNVVSTKTISCEFLSVMTDKITDRGTQFWDMTKYARWNIWKN